MLLARIFQFVLAHRSCEARPFILPMVVFSPRKWIRMLAPLNGEISSQLIDINFTSLEIIIILLILILFFIQRCFHIAQAVKIIIIKLIILFFLQRCFHIARAVKIIISNNLLKALVSCSSSCLKLVAVRRLNSSASQERRTATGPPWLWESPLRALESNWWS